jgi:hypothetical protein
MIAAHPFPYLLFTDPSTSNWSERVQGKTRQELTLMYLVVSSAAYSITAACGWYQSIGGTFGFDNSTKRD